MLKQALAVILMTLTVVGAEAQFVDGIYQKITDEKTCVKTEALESDEGPGYIEYKCNGPVEGISITYLTGSDWDNLDLTVGDKTYSFWNQIVATGSFAGFGNYSGIIEWVGKKGAQGFIEPVGLIIRFNGTHLDVNGNGIGVSQLAVYGIKDQEVCFKGFAKGKNENVIARELAKTGACLEVLEPEVGE